MDRFKCAFCKTTNSVKRLYLAMERASGFEPTSLSRLDRKVTILGLFGVGRIEPNKAGQQMKWYVKEDGVGKCSLYHILSKKETLWIAVGGSTVPGRDEVFAINISFLFILYH